MDLHKEYGERTLSADKAVKVIKPGSRVFIGTGCGEPQHLIKTIIADNGMHDIMLYQMLSSTLSHFVEDEGFL
ncbi:MAG TPA: hypothetical protein VJ969_02250, partial [Desulfopila sp.]|nr:hypothetical protein [Desulfopila sp.]